MKRLFLGLGILGLIVCTAILIAACGGGGGGGSKGDDIGPPPATTMAMDEASAARLMGLSMFGGQIGDAAGSARFTPSATDAADAGVEDRFIQTILNKVKEEAMAMATGYEANGKAVGSAACPYGGTLSANLRWDGPTVADCAQWVNLRGSMTMSGCDVGDAVMSGTMEISSTGVFCNPSALYLKFTNFNFNNSSAMLTFRSNVLHISASNLVWSGNTIRSGITVITGDINGQLEGDAYEAGFYLYTEDLRYLGGNDYTLDVSGSIRGGCLGDEWAAIETIQLIEFNSAGDCPTAGEVLVSGTGEMTIVINPDGGIDIGVDHYASCSDFEGPCVAGP